MINVRVTRTAPRPINSPASAIAGFRSINPRAIRSLNLSFTTRYKTPPTKPNLANALARFTNACVPNILLKPFRGFNLLDLGAIAFSEKLYPPIIPAARTAMISANKNIGRIDVKLLTAWLPNAEGSSASEYTSRLSNTNPDLKTSPTFIMRAPPNRYMKLATPIIMAATDNSCERATCPSSLAF